VHSLALARLWAAIGDAEQARTWADRVYRRAWADGEPHVYRWHLDRAREILLQFGGQVPDLPPYDPAKDPKLPWEDEVVAVIEKLEAEKQG
jgi:hypothetical protein